MHVEDSISKAGLARRTGRTPAAVTKWVRRGLPVRADGTISWAVARVWIKENVNAARSGSYGFRQRQREQAPAPAQTPAPAPAPANGRNNHADADADATSDIPAYTTSLAKKEASIAGIRELELEQKRGALAPVGPLQAWVLESVSYLRNHTWELPAALREREHSAAADLVERVLRRTFREWERYSRARAQHYGLRLPPPLPPPPPREQLAYYQRYVAGALDGRVESVPNAQQIGTVEWRRLHPSITTQQAFELIAKKKAWDASMCGLLKSRATWDLPEESATPKESIEVEEL